MTKTPLLPAALCLLLPLAAQAQPARGADTGIGGEIRRELADARKEMRVEMAKAKQDLDRPFVIFKHRGSTLLATAVVVLVVAFANIFTVIEPVMEAGDWSSALWMVGGPAFFSLLALGIYENYRRRTAVQLMVQES